MVAFTILIVLIIIVGAVMSMAVLMQNPKGSGLSGAFGGAGSSFGTMLGVRHASDVLQKATWWLAGIFVGLIMVLNLFFLPTEAVQESAIQRASEEQPLSPMPQGVPQQGTPQQGAPQQGAGQQQGAQQQTPPPPPAEGN